MLRSLIALTLCGLPAACALTAGTPLENNAPSRIGTTLDRTPEGAWRLLRDGGPFVVRGVGRFTNMDLAVAIGANTIRSYSAPLEPAASLAAARARLDAAHQAGLLVIQGIHIFREGPAFSYANPEHLERQRERVRASVRLYRDHPAILLWGLGNEAEGPRTKEVHPEFWRELDVLARIVKEEDPDRPVMTVIAGRAPWKIQAIKDHYPSLDILGVNTYGGAATLPRALDAAGWDKPCILTEFGPRGHWEVPKTEWDAPIEPGSEAKAANYLRGYRGAMDDPGGRMLGAVCFVWAQKQEITSTWYGMFLETGEKTPAVDAISLAYSGRHPANRSPRIHRINTDLDRRRVPPGAVFAAAVEADDAEDDPLAYEWKVVRESGARWAEGDREPVPPTIDGCLADPAAAAVAVRTPKKPGAYRLFVYVRDGRGGGAVQNVPFLVTAPEPPVTAVP